jgi:subtilase family serine protease
VSTHRRVPIIVAWMFVLASLLLAAAGPAVPAAQAAKDASISITADKLTVKAGDNDTLHIQLQNVKNATLDGQALKGDKIDRKVLVCTTTTYTVDGTDAGGKKISQSLTITATGTSTTAACLPDLAVTALTATQSYNPQNPGTERVRIDYTVENQGHTPAEGVLAMFYLNGKILTDVIFKELKAGDKVMAALDYWGKDGESRTYSLVLDPDNKIAEANKTNNTKVANTITVVVGQNPIGDFQKFNKLDHTPVIPKINLPDLAMVSLKATQSHDPQHPNDVLLRVDYTFENRGQAPATDILVDIYVNAQLASGATFALLKPGEQLTSWAAYSRPPGESLVLVVIDPNNEIPESNKSNNTSYSTTQ